MGYRYSDGPPPIRVDVDEPGSPFGSDPPEQLFFIHGWPDDPSLWDAQVQFFVARGYRCLRVAMPHYSGRMESEASGDLERPWLECDWSASVERLAQAVRQHSNGHRVTLVIHDWGSVWGFYLQAHFPQLVKAIVAMDVGPWTMEPKWRNVAPMLTIGFMYQYWLAAAHIISRASSAATGKAVADWMTRAFARLAKKSLGDKANVTDAVTADACYPYYYIHRNFLRELLGLASGTVNGFPTPPGGGGKSSKADTPSVPCLFFYGAGKSFMFHNSGWEKHLKRRTDCEVVAVDAGHWLQVECPDEVNTHMEKWLATTLPAISSAAASPIAPRMVASL